MDPVTTTVEAGLTAAGYGAYIPLALAVIGAASMIATVYPPTWPGAKILHTFALLKGNAKPAIPAGTSETTKVS